MLALQGRGENGGFQGCRVRWEAARMDEIVPVHLTTGFPGTILSRFNEPAEAVGYASIHKADEGRLVAIMRDACIETPKRRIRYIMPTFYVS